MQAMFRCANRLRMVIHTESSAQQEKIVTIMKEEWPNYLVTERLSQNTEEKELPSPHALRRRILVKVRPVSALLILSAASPTSPAGKIPCATRCESSPDSCPDYQENS
jgi:hypothetical protein